jgi:hypothetical protein
MKFKQLFTRKFYLYLYYRIKRSDLKTLLFFDYKVLIAFLALFFLNVIFFFPGDVHVHLPSLAVQTSVVENLLRTISIFLGILFSFIVLSFNVFYKYFGRFAFQSFFRLVSIRRLFTLFVLTIVFLLYAMGYLKELEQEDSYSKSLFILSISISAIATLAIVPTIIFLLRQSQSREHIKSLISNLNLDWMLSYYENIRWTDRKERHYEKDPITLLTEIGTPAIKEFDFTTSKLIVNGCLDFFEKVIKKEKVEVAPKELYWEFAKLFLNLYQIAVKERNENVMYNLISARLRLEHLVMDNLAKVELWDKPGKYDGFNYRYELKDYFNRAVQFNEDNVSQKIIDNYRDFGKRLIEDILPGRFKYDEADRTKDMDEQSIVHNYVHDLNYIMSVLITAKKFHLYRNISNLFYTLDAVTASSKNTHDSKRFILHVLDYTKYETLEAYVRNSGIKTLQALDYPYHLSPGTVLREAEITIPFHGLLKSMNLLLSFGLLTNMSINCVKADAFFLIDNLTKDQLYKNLLLRAINKFAELRDYVSENDSDYRKDTYIKLGMYLGYIEKWAKGKGVNDGEILGKITEVLEGFKYREKFKEELVRKGHLFDDKIT